MTNALTFCQLRSNRFQRQISLISVATDLIINKHFAGKYFAVKNAAPTNCINVNPCICVYVEMRVPIEARREPEENQNRPPWCYMFLSMKRNIFYSMLYIPTLWHFDISLT